MLGGTWNKSLEASPKEPSYYPLNDNFNDKPLYTLNDYNEKTINIPKVNTKNIKSNINNNTYTDADSLVEYFHGMLLSHINVEKNEGELSDHSIKLLNVINDYNKQKLLNKIKFNGGSKYYDLYNNYHNDDVIGDVTNKYIIYDNIEITYNYYHDEKIIDDDFLIHEINIRLYDNNAKTNNHLEINELSGIDLVIDIKNAMIYEKNKKIKTRQVYESSVNIDYLLEKIIEKMIDVMYSKNKEKRYIIKENYDNNNNNNNKNNVSIYYSVLSLLIIIRSFRNNIDKNIYTKYIYTCFLKDLCCDISLNKYLFRNNKHVFLTYDDIINNNESTDKYPINFNGDCALNTLMCVKNKDIQKWLIVKKELIEKDKYPANINNIVNINLVNNHNNLVNDYNNLVNNYNNYVDYINNIIDKFNCDENIKNEIKEYIEGYNAFIESIYNYKNWLININGNKTDTLIYNLELFIKYELTIRCILMDYNKDEEFINYIIDKKKYYNEKIKKIIQYTRTLDLYEIKNLKYIYKYYKKIIKTIANPDLFYINIIIKLLLINSKVEYLFDQKIFEIYKDNLTKKYAIQRFRNISIHRNEMDRIRFDCQTLNGHDYLFKYVAIPYHAILLIVDVDTNNINDKKYHICDLNHQNFIILNGTLPNSINSQNTRNNNGYNYINLGKTRFAYNYYYYLTKFYKKQCRSKILEINKKLSVGKPINESVDKPITYQELFLSYVTFRNNATNYYYNGDYYFRFIGSDNIGINTQIINLYTNVLEMTKSIFIYIFLTTPDNETYKMYKNRNIELNNDIKKCFLNKLNTYKDNNNVDSIKNKLINNIDKNIIKCKECINSNFLYYLIIELYNFMVEYKNNGWASSYLDDFYRNIIIDYNRIRVEEIKEAQTFIFANESKDPIYEYINTVLGYYSYSIPTIKIFGGEQLKINNSSHNNSIIKKILIILLVIVIIIIIVLIVLYVINKYNNKNILK